MKSQLEPTGNTNTVGKKPANNQHYRWAFTLKAIDGKGEPIDPRVVRDNLHPYCKEYYYQLEEGKEGYLHYQGCFSLISKERFSTVVNIAGFNGMHLEPVINWNASKNYCKKEKSKLEGPWNHRTIWIKTIKVLNEWQNALYTLLIEEPDDRTIYWYWDSIGNIGKTAFCKFAAINMGATVIGNGKGNDIAYTIPDDPKIIIFDFPRTIEGRINYNAIEKCKDGIIFSGKYESHMKYFNSPHVICFANFPPDMGSMSIDRWKVVDLGLKNISASPTAPSSP